MAAPNRPSIAYVGDGAWGMSLNEMLTCVRENIPTIAVVFNNRQWGAEKKNQVTHRYTWAGEVVRKGTGSASVQLTTVTGDTTGLIRQV